ncbi:hypothetical protein [Treponema sp. R8-4-B8]
MSTRDSANQPPICINIYGFTVSGYADKGNRVISYTASAFAAAIIAANAKVRSDKPFISAFL